MSLETILPKVLPAIFAGLGTGLEYRGNQDAADAAISIGQRQANAYRFKAAQETVNAGQAQGAGQLDAQEQRRQGALIQSRALALAAASGGGTTDPTVVNVIKNIAGEASYRSSVALYGGEEKARQLRMAAAADTFNAGIVESDAHLKADAYKRGATSALLKGAGGLFAKYGQMDQPKPGPWTGNPKPAPESPDTWGMGPGTF